MFFFLRLGSSTYCSSSATCASSAAASVAALDSMNFWIGRTRDSLIKTIGVVDMVLMNDAELRMLTEEPNLVKAAAAVRAMGPRVVIAKQGEYGAALFTEDGFFALPAFPAQDVRDPTGAGDSFAGSLMGYLDSQGGTIDDATLRRAMAYGSTLASFWVEEFGCEQTERLTREEIDERYDQFKRITGDRLRHDDVAARLLNGSTEDTDCPA